MAITETNQIDSLGISKDKTSLALLLTDHLDWENEKEHLLLLQDKINAYIGFIQDKQYESIYPDCQFSNYIIDIRFKENITQNCADFLNVVATQVSPLSITIQVTVVS